MRGYWFIFTIVAMAIAQYTTPEQREQLKKARAAMKNDPGFFDESIGRMSAEAQTHGKAIRELIFNEEDPAAMASKIGVVRAPLSAAILKELDEHRDRLVEHYGLPK